LSRGQILRGVATVVLVVLAGALMLRYDLASFLTVTPSATEKPAPDAAARPPRAAKLPQQAATEKGDTKFDVVRIDPDGASVFAGRAPANSSVTVMANDRPVANATADANGDWSVVIEKPFKAGDYQLSLTAKPKVAGAAQVQGQSVRITIASDPRGVASSASMSSASQSSGPLPVTFTYNQATFTAEGARAAAALGKYLGKQKLSTITLTGHADERGTDQYNMELSQQRLDTVARYLRQNGFSGKLVLMPKGKTEPYAGLDRRFLTAEQAFQLDRRVELRTTE
jgi:outer membrane protein OmpA-like peptidoglycan-associated protein